MIGKFVTAKLKGQVDPRQGWVIYEDPLLIQGESGVVYECEGTPVVVVNPPHNTVFKRDADHVARLNFLISVYEHEQCGCCDHLIRTP